MAEYTLTYFNAKARGELTRLLFAKAGVEYVDNRIEFADWPEIKPSTPWGTLPVLKTSTIEIGQSGPCARYLAIKYGLAGKDTREQGMADSIVDATADIFNKYITVMFMPEGEEKDKANKDLSENLVPQYMRSTSKILVANGGQFMVGDSMTWADIAVMNNLHSHIDDPEMANKYPELMALVKRIADDPPIKKWIETRPVTEQ